MIMSANEDGFFDLIDITNPASPIAYSLPGAPLRPSFDSSAVDTTGIVVAGGEGSGNILIGDLSQATFSTSPPIWNAPNQIENLPEFAPSFGYFSSGITGMAIAFGSNEVFLEDEEGTAGDRRRHRRDQAAFSCRIWNSVDSGLGGGAYADHAEQRFMEYASRSARTGRRSHQPDDCQRERSSWAPRRRGSDSWSTMSAHTWRWLTSMALLAGAALAERCTSARPELPARCRTT